MRDIETEGHEGLLLSKPALRHNFARFNAPQMGVATTGESVPQLLANNPENDLKLLTGYRNLTDNQIARLASEIVDEIRLRSATSDQDGVKYPFLSLSEFINRAPKWASNTGVTSEGEPIQDVALRGALQAAID